MVLFLYATLSLATFLAVSVHHVQLSPVTIPEVSTTIEPTDGDYDSDDTGSNFTAYQTTKSIYLDFPRIGYRIFLKKMLEALRILNFFMNMDPMFVRFTRTYLFFNRTADNTTDIQSHATSENSENLETNTEAPPQYQLPEVSTEPGSNPQPLSQYEDNESSKKVDVTQSKVQPEGFFSKVASVVSSAFHKFTSWF